MSVCMYVCLSVHPSVHPSVCLSVCLPIYLTQSVSMKANPTQCNQSDNWFMLYARLLCYHIHVIKTLSNTFNIEKKTDWVRRGTHHFSKLHNFARSMNCRYSLEPLGSKMCHESM